MRSATPANALRLVKGHLAQGDAVDEIVKCARWSSADLLIVGTDDAAGLERFAGLERAAAEVAVD
jgi:nucleotide-binding universal stress UspA family protein